MCDLAVHLEREVLPEVPIRHWICSLPWGLRALLGYDSELCGEVPLDGVYVADAQSLRFLPLPTPTRADVASTARRTADRTEKILRAHGTSLDPDASDAAPVKLQLEHPVVAACDDAAARGIAVSGERHEDARDGGIPGRAQHAA